MPHEGQAQHLEQIVPLLVHGVEVRADGAEVLRALEGDRRQPR